MDKNTAFNKIKKIIQSLEANPEDNIYEIYQKTRREISNSKLDTNEKIFEILTELDLYFRTKDITSIENIKEIFNRDVF